MRKAVCWVMIVVYAMTMVGGCADQMSDKERATPTLASPILHKRVDKDFVLPNASVRLVSYSVDSTQSSWTFDLQTVFTGEFLNEESNFSLVAASAADRLQGKEGVRYSLFSESRELEFELELDWDPSDLTYIELFERTNQEEQYLRIAHANQMVTEKYVLPSGDSLELSYPESLVGFLDGSGSVSYQDGYHERFHYFSIQGFLQNR